MIQIPLIPYMLGKLCRFFSRFNLYDAGYFQLSRFVLDSGFYNVWLSGEQNYELPGRCSEKNELKVFEYEKFDYSSVETETFQFATFNSERVEEKELIWFSYEEA